MEGSIAGFGDQAIIAFPDFAEIYRGPSGQAQAAPKEDSLM